jgi:hypothetical protein
MGESGHDHLRAFELPYLKEQPEDHIGERVYSHFLPLWLPISPYAITVRGPFRQTHRECSLYQFRCSLNQRFPRFTLVSDFAELDRQIGSLVQHNCKTCQGRA